MNDDLTGRVAQILTRYNMLSRAAQVGVAVSGGADSVGLLHLLHRLSGEFGVQLTVLHVNHLLRGAESDADEQFVCELAGSLGLPWRAERIPLPPGNLEQEARRIRRAFFASCQAALRLDRIALGHTRSDQAETVLYRFLRGSGLRGLAGMEPVAANGWIRPLLPLSREEVRQWVQAEGFSWREDSSNNNFSFVRNRLRLKTMPALQRQYNPNLEAVLAGTAELARDEEIYWSGVVEAVFQAVAQRSRLGSILQVDKLLVQPVALQRRVLRRALGEVRGHLRSLDKSHIDAILRVCGSSHGHDRVMVPGLDAVRSFHLLLLRPVDDGVEQGRDYQVSLPFGQPCFLPYAAGTIQVARLFPDPENCASFKKDQELVEESAELNGTLLSTATAEFASLAVRNWQPGDQLQRAGHKQPEKIKTLFGEARVPLWERRHWPMVVAGDEIVWVRKFGAAAKYTALPENPERMLLTYSRSCV